VVREENWSPGRRARFYREGVSPAETLLSGPRGRALCWAALRDGPRGRAEFGEPSRSEVLARVAGADLAALAAASGEFSLWSELADVVTWAVYWQQPFDAATDRALASEDVRTALQPVAEAIAAAPGTRWWWSPAAADGQCYAQFLDEHSLPEPRLSGAADLLRVWRADTIADEVAADDRPMDPAAPWSGHWWSAPSLSSLPVTTRALPGLGAVRLALVEDSMGWRSARCWPLTPRAGARIYEVHDASQWTELVSRYPLDVTRSRRHDWWRVTGWAGPWMIPDYAAVAGDYDAVHVSVAGYLAAAGRALPVGDACTMLAGWDPDATWWLTDALSPAGPPADWRSADGDPQWVLASVS
jgi:hypothetical protein